MSVKAGQRFGKLTTETVAGNANDGHKIWLCRCDCGAEVFRQTNSLLQRFAGASCGCSLPKPGLKHGMRGSSEYASWQSAKARCLKASHKDFPSYGGRGISMCEEWSASFEEFYKSMGPRPVGTTLERRDNNGNYEPGNCVWATPKEQARNRRRSVYVARAGERQFLGDVAEKLGISYGAAFMRLKRGKLNDYVRV